MQIPHISPANAAGLLDKVVGLGKEITGTVISNQRLTKAGQLQQEKGSERIKALEAEVKSQGHEAKAKSAQQAERSAQRAKANA